MDRNYNTFLKAINEKKIVIVTFNSKEKGIITRKSIPFDYGPWRRNLKVNPDRYHFYDLNSPEGQHNLSILSEQIINIEITNERFDPADYVKWKTNWFIKRNRGICS